MEPIKAFQRDAQYDMTCLDGNHVIDRQDRGNIRCFVT